jgi:hypothetical protein
MLRGTDFVILTHGEIDSLVRLAELVPLSAIQAAVKNADLGVSAGYHLVGDLKRTIYPQD